MELRKKDHRKPMYRPWFPVEENESNFLSYIHEGLHHVNGEDVGFPDSSWSYTKAESPFDITDRSDLSLHDKVIDALYRNESIDASGISILVHNGVVNLGGKVKTEAEKSEAEKEIRKNNLVWNVENEISVEPDSLGRKMMSTQDFK